MRIAVISDIHSNHLALESVIKDIKSKDIDFTICLGDMVGYSPFPNETIGLIRANSILAVLGNYDEAVGQELMICGCDYPDPRDAENAGISLNWTIDNTSEENKAYLRSLPKEVTMIFENKAVAFVHGSPRQLNEYLKENSKEADEVMTKFEGDILVCGHTHKPYYKAYGDKLLVNSGSVGKSKAGSPDANYVVLDIKEGNTEVEIMQVAYDYEVIAKAIEDNGLPKEFAEIIRTGKA